MNQAAVWLRAAGGDRAALPAVLADADARRLLRGLPSYDRGCHSEDAALTTFWRPVFGFLGTKFWT